jgi:hypothetical protein
MFVFRCPETRKVLAISNHDFSLSSGKAGVNSGTIPPDHLLSYYWTGLLTLDHSYLVGNLTKIAETKALDHLKS